MVGEEVPEAALKDSDEVEEGAKRAQLRDRQGKVVFVTPRQFVGLGQHCQQRVQIEIEEDGGERASLLQAVEHVDGCLVGTWEAETLTKSSSRVE